MYYTREYKYVRIHIIHINLDVLYTICLVFWLAGSFTAFVIGAAITLVPLCALLLAGSGAPKKEESPLPAGTVPSKTHPHSQ